ncbi:MAG: TonB-dependent receptor [Wenyingzhuangia sp.]|jgi:TonB-dependent starch-binding outer membrane protein SusC|uniref:SusC/RagA family TonB-linked outer membrane protein n=1 Tax=Wenyingzhuangia sp. TaxID=1964193 RepID=UPI00321960E9
MKLKKSITLIALLFFNIALFAQGGFKLSGKILSNSDQSPVPGANVIIKGGSSGTISDFDGNYQIAVKAGDVVVVSYIGFTSQEVVITDQTSLTTYLEEDASELEEIVVVGYGARKKSDLTGSVSSVKTEELTAFPVLDAAQALQGRAAGVVVQSNNGGEPGAPISIKIRGNTSINASSSPLIVVDGFVGGAMPQPNDIASLEVLKDASAAAIYGSRGSNGVVLVTTKKGKKGALNIELNSTYAVQNTANRLDLLNAGDFATYQQEVFNNQALTAGESPVSYSGGSENTDWQDLIYQQGNTQNHQLSFSGGSEKTNFYASGNYFKQEGVVVNSGFERATFLSNIDSQVTDKLKLGLNLFGSRSTQNGIATQASGGVTAGNDDVVTLSMRFSPDLGVIAEDGSFQTDTRGDFLDNPYAVATERINETITDNFRANSYLSYDILEGLTFRTTLGFSSVNQTEGLFLPSTLPVTASQKGGEATLLNSTRSTILSENYLTYIREIGKGKLTLLGGYSYQKDSNETFTAGAQKFPSNSVGYHNLNAGAVTMQPTSFRRVSETLSQFGRVNYDYDDRYLLTATIRRDGASNFSKNEKYATFPSAALGWKISNESFFQNVEAVSNLKLRASWGETGNQAISPYGSLASLRAIYSSVNGQQVNAVTPDQPSNPDLKWETSVQTNIGLDLGLLKNRINLSLDYYNIDTKDLIMRNTGLPKYFGFLNDEILANVGEINNQGFEISLNANVISTKDFSWNTDINWSTNKNKVVKLLNNTDWFNSAAPSYFSVGNTYILREGEAVGQFWGYDYVGVHQGGDLPEGTVGASSTTLEGDPLFKDLDGDGVRGAKDQTIIGDPNPDFTYGFNNNLSYKNWDLNIFIQGSQGGEIFNMTNVQLYNGESNTTYDYFNASKDGSAPRAGNNSTREISSRFVEDGSYIRLKNVALGYNLPENIVEKIGFENVRLSVSAQNLFTITDYSGLDPEVSYFGGSGSNNTKRNTAQGFDFGNYPTLQSVNFSLNIKF